MAASKKYLVPTLTASRLQCLQNFVSLLHLSLGFHSEVAADSFWATTKSRTGSDVMSRKLNEGVRGDVRASGRQGSERKRKGKKERARHPRSVYLLSLSRHVSSYTGRCQSLAQTEAFQLPARATNGRDPDRRFMYQVFVQKVQQETSAIGVAVNASTTSRRPCGLKSPPNQFQRPNLREYMDTKAW